MVFVVVAILGFTGWFVWNSQKNTDKTLSDANKSTQAVTAQKKPAQETAQPDESSSWTLVTTAQKGFTVRIPDGWKGANYGGADLLRFSSIEYVKGTKPAIENPETPYAGDSEVPLRISIDEKVPTAGERTGTKTAVKLGSLNGYKYVTKWTTSTEPGLGARSAGDADYTYVFSASADKELVVSYYAKAGGTDQSALVEKVIATIEL